MRSFALLAALAIAAVPVLSGCDETIPTTPEDLLVDARIARQAGDINKAVDLLERAHTADRSDAVVRVELASALFSQADLDVSDLDRIATYLLDGADAGTLDVPAPEAPDAKGNACPYETAPGAEPFDPRDLAEYGQYLDRGTVSARVRDLLDPIISDQLRPSDFLCNGITETSGQAELNYDPDAALAAMRAADSRLTDELIASALAVNAVAEALDTYMFLSNDLRGETAWYRLANGNLGVCPVGVTEEELRDLAEESIADLGEALLSIDLRSRILGSGEVSTELVDIVLDAYDEVRDDLAPYCPNA
jgi:hypothetical protein